MRHPVLLLLAAAALTACGASKPPADPAKVTLQIVTPGDGETVRTPTVAVRGTVSPSRASVEVVGRPAIVSGGTFIATVPLAEGANVVDVSASASGRSTTMTALRVTRDTRVEVPQLVGAEVGEAQQHVRDAGLRPREDRGGGFFDPLLPGPWRVCETEPPPGAKVTRGSTVTLRTAKRC